MLLDLLAAPPGKGVDVRGKIIVCQVNDPDFAAAPGEPVAATLARPGAGRRIKVTRIIVTVHLIANRRLASGVSQMHCHRLRIRGED